MNTVLIDTSIWLAYFRGTHVEWADRVVELLDRGEAVCCGSVLVEVASEAVSPEAAQSLTDALRGMPHLPTTDEVFSYAAELAAYLRPTAPVPPMRLLVAATATIHRVSLLTADTRLHAASRLRPLRLLCA